MFRLKSILEKRKFGLRKLSNLKIKFEFSFENSKKFFKF